MVSISTPKPNGFADHDPYEKWLFHWEYTPIFRHTHMCVFVYGKPLPNLHDLE